MEAVQSVNRRLRIQPATEGKGRWLAECTRQMQMEGETCHIRASQSGVRLSLYAFNGRWAQSRP